MTWNWLEKNRYWSTVTATIMTFCLPHVLTGGELEDDAKWLKIIKQIGYKINNTDWTPHRISGVNRSSLQSELPSKSEPVGDFIVTWNQESASLSINHKEEPTRELWASSPGKAFVLAALGQEDISQSRGSFTIKDKGQGIRCIHQTVDDLKRKAEHLIIKGTLSGSQCELNYQLLFNVKSDKRLGFHLKFEAQPPHLDFANLNRSFLIYKTNPDEKFFGFGEQFSHFNLRGKKVPIFAQEQGHLRGIQPHSFLLNRISNGSAGDWSTTYTAIPHYITNQNRSLFLENYHYSLFDLSRRDVVELRVWANEVQGQIVYGSNPKSLISEYTEFSGRMKALPEWFHKGAIIGIMGGSERVRMIWDRLKTHKTPISAMWLQDWVGKRDTGLGIRMWWNWTLDRQSYPDWEKLVAEFKADGIETLGYINPFLSDASSKPDANINLFQIAKDRGYLVQLSDGTPAEIDSGGFTGTLVDLTNPDARKWLKDYLKKEMFGLGMKGWMADFGEALPHNIVLKSGIDPLEYHNKYLEDWARLNQEVIQEAGLEGEAVVFLRNAAQKSPTYAPLFWAGDQMVTWDEHDGLKSSITGILSGGISGMSINHSDVGGLIHFKRKVLGLDVNYSRDQELMIRWSEINAFSPVYRTHEGNNPKKNHQFYSHHITFKAFSYFAKVYQALFDYRKELFKEAEATGIPVMRHLYLEYPNDPEVFKAPYQYMLGSEFLVAGVTESGKREKEVYLPAGTWVHLWTGAIYSNGPNGHWVTVDAPVGDPPVFYKKGSPWGDKLVDDLKKIRKNFEVP